MANDATFMEGFSDLKDPRDDKNKKHQLMDILFLVIAPSSVARRGAIETFGKEKALSGCGSTPLRQRGALA
jgi:hypothetical protein